MKHLRYTGDFYDVNSVTWRVEIWQEAQAPYQTVRTLTFPYPEPLTIEWPETSKEDALCSSTATLRIESPGDRTYADLYAIEAGSIRMDVYRADSLYWSGTLDTEFYEEPYERYSGYDVTLTFSDFGILERVKMLMVGVKTFKQIILQAIADSQINTSALVETAYTSTYFTDGTKADLDKLAVRADNFIDEEGERSSMMDVVKSVLQPLGQRMVQRAGKVYVYDLNGIHTAGQLRQIQWDGTTQTMGVDKVANNVRVTFSPYSTDGSLLPEVSYTGKTSVDAVHMGNAYNHDDVYGEYYSYYEANKGHLTNVVDFTIFLDTATAAGKGLAYKNPNAMFFKILPVVGSASESEGVAWTVRAGVGSVGDTSAPPRLIGQIPTKGSSTVVMRTAKAFLPKLDAEDARGYKLRLSLEMMLDARYNPFREAKAEGNVNEYANDDDFKEFTGYAFVPVGITLYDLQGSAILHYTNSAIVKSSALGHIRYAQGSWAAGAASYGDAWLEYYNPDDQQHDSGIRGWQKNRQAIGRHDTASRQNPDFGTPPFEIYNSLKQMDPGEYLPYPSQGGYLEVTVYEGVRCFDYGELTPPDNNEAFETTYEWTRRGLHNKVRWLLYKAPEVQVVRNNLSLDAADLDDVEYSGYINRAAKEEMSIDTIVGTADGTCPTARGILCHALSGLQLQKLKRAGVVDHPEKLLIGTIYSQFASRHTKLSGEAVLDYLGVAAFTEANQGEKKFLIMGETQDIAAATSEIVAVELSPDQYEAIEEVTE